MRIKLENRTVARDVKGKAAWQPFFHRLRPLASIPRNLTLKSVVAKPEQDYKDPRRFPLVALPSRALSCSCLSGLPVSFRCYGPRLSHSTPDTQFRVGRFAPNWTVHDPRSDPTTTPVKATGTRVPISERHNELPLVVATGNRFTELEGVLTPRVLEVKAQIRLHWKDEI